MSGSRSFQCPLCSVPAFTNLKRLLRHIKLKHAEESSFSIQCNFQGCKRTFKKFSTFKGHLSNFHTTLELDCTMTSSQQEFEDMNNGGHASTITTTSNPDELDLVQSHISMFTLMMCMLSDL